MPVNSNLYKPGQRNCGFFILAKWQKTKWHKKQNGTKWIKIFQIFVELSQNDPLDQSVPISVLSVFFNEDYTCN